LYQCSAVNRLNTSGALVPSSADATETTTTSSNPSVSTMIWRFRPVIFWPPSEPRPSATSVALTVWLSMLPALRSFPHGIGIDPQATGQLDDEG